MRRKWETVRVFISSTFRDMQAERDYLVRHVFPGLREKLERHRIHLIDIDLRWGVTKEDADNDQVLGLCLQLIDESRPFFIGLLGERYGWVPKSHPAEALAKYGWIKEEALREHSVTALEIIHGVLRDPKMESLAFFYFRDPAFLQAVPEPLRSDIYVETDPQSKAKLGALKSEVAHRGFPLFDRYPCRWNEKHENPDGTHGRIEGLKEFGERIEQDLWEGCCRKFDWLAEEERQYQEAVAKSEEEAAPQGDEGLEEERDFHERFIESRLRVFVGRESLLDDLASYLQSGSTKPLVLTGPSGCGKSAILGKLYLDHVKDKGYTLDVPHFVGASPGSTSLYTTLRRFCLELQRAFNITDEIPADPYKLPMAFQEFLKKVPSGGKVVFLIDAVNQFDASSQAESLGWMPYDLPLGVKIVLSTIEEGTKPSTTMKTADYRGWEIKRVEPLTPKDRLDIVRLIPSLAAKRLDDDQIKLLLDNPATDNPLYLAVAIEELRGFGSFEQLNKRISEFPPDGLDALFAQVLEQVEREFAAPVVRKVLSLVAVSRQGMSETELKELITDIDREEDLFPLLRRLRLYLLKRGQYVDFYHRNLFKAVRAHYLKKEDDVQVAHKELADYFYDKGSPNKDNPWKGTPKRSVSELPYHLMEADSVDEWMRLGKTLCSLEFVEAKVNHGMTYDLVRDFLEAEKRVPNPDLLGSAWIEWKQFVDLEAGNLDRYAKEFPQITFQQAYNQPINGVVSRAAQELRIAGNSPKTHWFERVNRPEEFARSACLKVMEGHTWKMLHIALTGDGRVISVCMHSIPTVVGHVYSAWSNTTLRVWDLETGQCLKVMDTYTGRGSGIALTGDGRAVTPIDRTLRVWDLATGQCLQVLEGHKYDVTHVALTGDGRAVSASREDFTLRVWDLATGQCLKILKWYSGALRQVALNDDGRAVLAFGDRDNTLRVWDLETGECLKVLKGHTSYVTHVALTDDGRVVSASSDGSLRVWDLETGECLKVLKGHTRSVHYVALTDDGRAVSASEDKTLRVWDLATGQCLKVLEGHTDQVRHIALTGNGRVVSASGDKTLRVWDPETGRCLKVLEGHTQSVRHVTLTGDGRAVSTSSDNTIRVWDLEVEMVKCQKVLKWHTSRLHHVALTGDGRAISASSDNTLRVWDLLTGGCLKVLEGHGEGVRHVALTGDGRAVSASFDKTLRVWDLETGECLEVLEGHNHWVLHVALTDDGQAVSASYDKTLRIWDLTTGQCLKVLEGHTDQVRHIALTGDGRVVSASEDGTLRIWELATGQCLKVLLGHKSFVGHVALTGDGLAVSSYLDYTLRVWDLATGQCIEVCKKDSKEAAIWKSRCLAQQDAGDPSWSYYNYNGPGYYMCSDKNGAVYPGVYNLGGGAPSGKQGIFFDKLLQPHILHLHGPGIDKPGSGGKA